MADPDKRLQELLAPPERPADRAFVKAVNRAVQIEQRLRRARSAAWRKFLIEVAATIAVLVPAALATANAGAGDAITPGLLMLVMLGLWSVMLRPASAPAI